MTDFDPDALLRLVFGGGPGLGSPLRPSVPSAFYEVQKITLASTRPIIYGASGSGKGSPRKPDPQYFAKKY